MGAEASAVDRIEMKKFWSQGEQYVWISGATLAFTLLITLVLIMVVVFNGFGVFWPSQIEALTLRDGSHLLGQRIEEEVSFDGTERVQFKIGNRDLYGLDFRWVTQSNIVTVAYPEDLWVVERQEYGNFYGYLESAEGQPLTRKLLDQQLASIAPDLDRAAEIKKAILKTNRRSERLRNKVLKLTYHGAADSDPDVQRLEAELSSEKEIFAAAVEQQSEVAERLEMVLIQLRDINGRSKTMPLQELVRAYRPNQMTVPAKTFFYLAKIRELLLDEPRESNTEGGLFPAIFGTIVLVFLMSLLSFPLGVIGGVYLREYAKDGMMVRLVRIAVNNLAGIPSIVYGVFGLGFFVYGVGGAIDSLFFPERLPTPTFGTGGILWAGLTLGILTVPVVIVATEEAFGAIPHGVREASLALGATKFQTLRKVLFPMASPGILTGFILAMSRAAGEVAPLMITGVVKLAPSLPLDGQAPFLHFDRKFMHLGFHIYDIGFQSPNVEAAKPMVYVTTLLLVLVVLLMTSSAIRLRNRMKEKYTITGF